MSRHLYQVGILIALAALAATASIIFVNINTNGIKADQKPAPQKIFGIADPDLISETPEVQARQISNMKAIGITSVRIDANWSWVQPNGPNEFKWSNLDQEVKSIRTAGMSADLIIDGCPPWAALPGAGKNQFTQPAHPSQYASWAADVAARYAPEGVRYFEIWNEPNIIRFWKPRPNPAAYTADLRAAYTAIKTIDPSAFVISGGLAPAATVKNAYSPIDFLKAMYKNGAENSFDALGYHPYSYPALPNDPGTPWSQIDQTSPSLRSSMAENGDSAKLIWITEFGAPSAGSSGVDAAAQAVQLSQALADVKDSKWIGGFYIYTWRDGPIASAPGNEFGLLTASAKTKPAFSVVAAALAGSRPPESHKPKTDNTN
jgi:hypothetical protein